MRIRLLALPFVLAACAGPYDRECDTLLRCGMLGSAPPPHEQCVAQLESQDCYSAMKAFGGVSAEVADARLALADCRADLTCEALHDLGTCPDEDAVLEALHRWTQQRISPKCEQ